MYETRKILIAFLATLILINIFAFTKATGNTFDKNPKLLSKIAVEDIQSIYSDDTFAPLSFDIQLSSGVVKPSPIKTRSTLTAMSSESNSKQSYYLIQFYNLSEEQYQFLVSNNVTFLSYVPYGTYIVKGSKELIESIGSLRWIGTLSPEQKISPELKQVLDSTNEGKINVSVVFFEPLSETQLNRIEQISENVLYYSAPYDLIALEANVTKINDIANLDFVKWLSMPPRIKLMLDKSSRVISVDNVWDRGNDASGVTVGIIDSGIQRNHPYFAGPDGIYGTGDDIIIIHDALDYVDSGLPEAICGESDCADNINNDNDYDANGNPKLDEGGHGVLVAGVISGQGTTEGRIIRGISNNADLVISRTIDSEADWPTTRVNPETNDIWSNILDPDNDGNYNEPSSADVISISWGNTNRKGVYDATSQRADDVTRGYLSGGKEVLVLVSAGNGGEGTNKKVLPPGTAKNALTVGASADFRNYLERIERQKDTDNDGVFELYPRGYDKDNLYMMDYSSRGTNDDRIKPDILAPGSAITTSALGGTYQSVDGTSFAAPHVAAVVAQILHNYPSASPALIKSMLITSAVGGGTTDNPDLKKAWGRLDAYGAIYQTPDEYYDVYYEGEVGNKNSGVPKKQGYDFHVPSGTKKLIITMVYSDDPGDPLVGILQNYLDLYIVTPSGSTALPNGHETKEDDTTNNVEKYVINNPQSGDWQAWIEARWLNDLYGTLSKTQDYAINIRIIRESQTPETIVTAYKSTTHIGNLHGQFTVYGDVSVNGLSAYDVYTELEIPDGLTIPVFEQEDVDGTDAGMDILGDIPADSNRTTKSWNIEAYWPGVYDVTLHVYGTMIDDVNVHETDTVTVIVCDQDEDGYYDHNCGGDDCDDGDPNRNPGQPENCNNGIDDDCDQAVDAADPDCSGACSCTGWSNQGCGQSPCVGTQMKQTRTCIPGACDTEQRCVSHASCGGCDSTSYTSCPSAYEMEVSNDADVIQNLCGEKQYFKVTTTKTCSIQWQLKRFGTTSDYDLYTRWDGSCPSATSYSCNDYTNGGNTAICESQNLPPGTYYAMSDRYFGSGGTYSIFVQLDCPPPCEPEPEVCDGQDNNCNGQVDESLYQPCGSGTCEGTSQCSNGIWGDCSTSGQDAGICALCDSDGNPTYDASQDSDCSPTMCPSDACGLGGCGLHIFADFPVSTSNECSALHTCTSNQCTPTCEADSDSDTYSPTCGDCDDTNENANPDAEEICGDGIDNDCNTQVDETCIPTMAILSPINTTYKDTIIDLNWSVDMLLKWAAYELNNQENVTMDKGYNKTCLNVTGENNPQYACDNHPPFVIDSSTMGGERLKIWFNISNSTPPTRVYVYLKAICFAYTNYPQTCRFSIYNFTAGDWDLIESFSNTNAWYSSPVAVDVKDHITKDGLVYIEWSDSGKSYVFDAFIYSDAPTVPASILNGQIIAREGQNTLKLYGNTTFGNMGSSEVCFSVRLSGDVNQDCIVDIFDLAAVGLAYGSQPGDPNWNEDADLNQDSIVNIFDLAMVGLNYGRAC